MKALLIAVGRLKSGPERELVLRYSERLSGAGRPVGLTGLEVLELPESRASSTASRKAEEAMAILDRLPERAHLTAFDETGKAITSKAFSNLLAGTLNAARVPAFVIGGPDGLDDAVRERADAVVAFGRLTMPHQIVRALVLEQLYRAVTIATGHPYHRV